MKCQGYVNDLRVELGAAEVRSDVTAVGHAADVAERPAGGLRRPELDAVVRELVR